MYETLHNCPQLNDQPVELVRFSVDEPTQMAVYRCDTCHLTRVLKLHCGEVMWHVATTLGCGVCHVQVEYCRDCEGFIPAKKAGHPWQARELQCSHIRVARWHAADRRRLRLSTGRTSSG